MQKETRASLIGKVLQASMEIPLSMSTRNKVIITMTNIYQDEEKATQEALKLIQRSKTEEEVLKKLQEL